MKHLPESKYVISPWVRSARTRQKAAAYTKPTPLPPLPAPFNLLVLSGAGHFVLSKTDIYGSPHAAQKEKNEKKSQQVEAKK